MYVLKDIDFKRHWALIITKARIKFSVVAGLKLRRATKPNPNILFFYNQCATITKPGSNLIVFHRISRKSRSIHHLAVEIMQKATSSQEGKWCRVQENNVPVKKAGIYGLAIGWICSITDEFSGNPLQEILRGFENFLLSLKTWMLISLAERHDIAPGAIKFCRIWLCSCRYICIHTQLIFMCWCRYNTYYSCTENDHRDLFQIWSNKGWWSMLWYLTKHIK